MYVYSGWSAGRHIGVPIPHIGVPIPQVGRSAGRRETGLGLNIDLQRILNIHTWHTNILYI